MESAGWKYRLFPVLVIFVAMFIGLPLRTAVACLQWNERSYEGIQRLVEESVGKSDVVLADDPTYYAVKTRAAKVFLSQYIVQMTKKEKDSVSVVLDTPEKVEQRLKDLGGRWEDTGRRILPVKPMMPLPAFIQSRISDMYSLVVYVRRPER